MPTVIRLKRGGRTHAPYYRVVVADSRGRATGRVLDELGVYQPCARPEPKVEIDREKALRWLRTGAQLTDTVRDLLSRQGLLSALAAEKARKAEPES